MLDLWIHWRWSTILLCRRVSTLSGEFCWDWRSCPLYGIRRFPHSSGCDHTQTDVNTLGTKRSICLQYHRWPLFRGFHKGGFHCIWGWVLPRRFITLLLNLLHGDILVTLYQAQNYSNCTCLPPQMTPIKPAFELQNYFYLSGYVSVLNDMEV